MTRYDKSKFSDHVDLFVRSDIPRRKLRIEWFQCEGFMQPCPVTLSVRLDVFRGSILRDSVSIASIFPVFFQQEHFTVVWYGHIRSERTKTAVWNSWLHRVTFDVGYEHVFGQDAVTWHLNPAL